MQQSYIITQVYPDIYRISIPLKGALQPGPINVYLIKGTATTLIDTGFKNNRDILEQALNEIGLSPKDIKQLIITHGHPDHFGAANFIRSQSNCIVYAHPEEKYKIENNREKVRNQIGGFLKLMGMPWHYQHFSLLQGFVLNIEAEKCRVDRTIEEGDTLLIGDYQAKIFEVPGHAIGCICIYLPEPNLLFSGDHILEHITPNPIVMLEPDRKLPIRLSQEEFYQSLSKILALNPDRVFTGHGKEINNLASIVAIYEKQFAQRQKRILEALESGPQNVYLITCKVFPFLARKIFPLELFLAISEVYTHLQVLEKNRQVLSHSGKKQLIYRLA